MNCGVGFFRVGRKAEMNQLIHARLITSVKLATELYVAIQCFFLLHDITHEAMFALLAAFILLALGQLPTVTTVKTDTRLQRVACSSIHLLILGVVESVSTFILFKRNQTALLLLFGAIASPFRIYLGLLLLIASFKVAVLLLPERLDLHNSTTTRSAITLLPRSNLQMTLSFDKDTVVRFKIAIRGGSGNDVDVIIVNEDGYTVMALDRVSGNGEWYINVAKGTYQLHVKNEFSFLASKKIKLYVSDSSGSTCIRRAILSPHHENERENAQP